MKKVLKTLIILLVVLIVLASIALGGLYIYYKDCIKAQSNESEPVELHIKEGLSSKQIIDEIYSANLLKNKYAGYVYLKLNKNLNLQAGDYDMNRNMSLEEILNKISRGEVIDNSISITFVEGKRINHFANRIAEKYPYTEEEIMKKLEDKDYQKTLIKKYWFLTEDILNDKLYYALEGYLYPNTYQFKEHATIEEIIEKILDNTGIVLNKYKKDIEESNYSVHEILTMASIVELEGGNSKDRAGVAGVFYNRLKNGWSLGSDVTTYYAAKVEMSERDLYWTEINDANDYNTRSQTMAGKLPVGPICSPSEDSIKASINPTNHDYFYFVADKNGKTYFSKNEAEHNKTIADLKSQGLWYVYR